MKNLYQVLDFAYVGLTKNDNDFFLIIVGDEGTGKSTLELHIIDYWYNKLNGVCVEDDCSALTLNDKEFVKRFSSAKKFDVVSYDEAGKLSNKRAMARFNVMLAQTYQIVRGENLFTIIVLPCLFDLDKSFIRRAKGLIRISRKTKFEFYTKAKLDYIMQINSYRQFKKIRVTNPSFYDWFPKYDGVMLKKYLERKNKNMTAAKQNFADDYLQGSKATKRELQLQTQRNSIIKSLRADGWSLAKIGKLMGVTKTGIAHILKTDVKCKEEE